MSVGSQTKPNNTESRWELEQDQIQLKEENQCQMILKKFTIDFQPNKVYGGFITRIPTNHWQLVTWSRPSESANAGYYLEEFTDPDIFHDGGAYMVLPNRVEDILFKEHIGN